jgi:hypothetical protein
MGRARSRSGRTAKLKALSWEGYLGKRLVKTQLWKQADRFTVAGWLLATALGPDYLAGSQYDPDAPSIAPQPTAPIWNQAGSVEANYATASTLAGIPVGLSGNLVDRTYLGTDLRTTLDAMTSLGNTGAGMDWHLTPYRDSATGQLAIRADLGYPRLGRVQPPGVEWSEWDTSRRGGRSGFLGDYTLTEDESAVVNRMTGVGGGQPPDQIRVRVSNYAEMSAGYPMYEGSLTDSATDDLVTAASVTAHAQGAMDAARISAVTVSGVKVRGDLAPTLDSYVVGDDATLRLSDVLTGERLTVVGQIIGRKITPPQQGQAEGVQLDVQGVTA